MVHTAVWQGLSWLVNFLLIKLESENYALRYIGRRRIRGALFIGLIIDRLN